MFKLNNSIYTDPGLQPRRSISLNNEFSMSYGATKVAIPFHVFSIAGVKLCL